MQGQVKTYRGSQTSATNQFRRDAARMAAQGLVPTTQTWAAGSYGCGSFVLAFLLCFILIGFLIFLYMLIVKPAGTLTVTYAYQMAAPATAPEKVCPKCAEHVKAAATVCRFCGFTFPEVTIASAGPTPLPNQPQRPVSDAHQAGRALAGMWRKKWFRVVTYTYAASAVILLVSSQFQDQHAVAAGQGQTGGTPQAAQPVDSQQLAKAKTGQDACKSTRDAQMATYRDLLKQGKDWEAAGTIRICANTLNDPEMKKLVATAEIDSHKQTIASTKASKEDKLRAMQMLVRDYPEVGKPYESKITALGVQIAKEEASADSARRRKQGVNIGMTAEEVKQSSWGRPESVNRTITSNGTHEQWVYSGSYLYFEDGVLTSIQN